MREFPPARNRRSTILPALALAAGGFLFGQSFEVSHLDALPGDSIDADNDGLVDVQESILFTSVNSPDSDGDGVGDLEEFSRGTDPSDITSVPVGSEVSLAMSGRVVDGVFKAVTALYVPDGDLTGDSISFGIQIGGALIPVNPMLLFVGAELTTVQPEAGQPAVIYLLETPLPESIVLSLGNVGIYATYTGAGSAFVQKAASLNLVAVNGVVAQIVQSPTTGGGSYRPLTEGPELPATWTPAQVCVQTLETVGAIGPVLQQEVVDASCQEAESESYCPPDCVNLIGETHDVVDPIGLIGG